MSSKNDKPFIGLEAKPEKGRVSMFVQGLVIFLMLGHASLWGAGGEDHDHDHDAVDPAKPSKSTKPPGKRRAAETQSEGDEACRIGYGDLANFANGDSYNYRSLVGFLTQPGCQANSRNIAANEMRIGVQFNRLPFHLDAFASGYSNLTLEGSRRVETSLANSIPGLLRESSMSNGQLLPILGQLSLLSPKAARTTLSYLIGQELLAGDQAVENSSKKKDSASLELAYSLIQMGANEPVIASEIADSVEEMAILAQADSLGKMLRGLANAAKAEGSLAPTFNMTAGAFNRGVQRGNPLYQPNDKGKLILATFLAIESAAGTTPALEPGAQDLNEAMDTLMGGKALVDSSLRKLWRQAVKVTGNSSSQYALATAIAASLTPEAIYLGGYDREMLLTAAKNYPEIAYSLQRNFIGAWEESRENLFKGQLKVAKFNSTKEKIFEPWVVAMLEFDAKVLDPNWLSEVVRRGLVHDEDIEKKFPRFVLTLMGEREKASKIALMESGLEPTINSAFQNFAVLWTLSNVHVPALNKWVKKYEE